MFIYQKAFRRRAVTEIVIKLTTIGESLIGRLVVHFKCIGRNSHLRELRTHKQKLFLLSDGESTAQLGKAFGKVLQSSCLKESLRGLRALYSLRHTFITLQLLNGKSMVVIARQRGTSATIIEQHYSQMFAYALSGVTFDKEEPKALSKKTLNRRAKTAERDENRFKEWAEELRRRGCI
ncbi:hypothetical protein [Alteromonas macleodii]|uniref:hypothetical protein n=1 Tax=Alteromonas macleodii TaxID=28108 RepID=UPI001E54EFF7|nr:hypothetical protein [Alteromonas macleodii]